MTLAREEVKKIAQVARLKLTGEDEERLARELGAALDFVQTLENEKGLAREEPTYQVTGLKNVYRGDEERVASETLTPSQVLANAPQKKDGYFQVPPVLN